MVHLEDVKCDLCGRNGCSVFLKTRDYRFGRPEVYTIVKCDTCGLISLNPRPTMESITELYQKEYTPENSPISLPETKRLSSFKKKLIKFLPKLFGNYIHDIPMKGRVLDVGCGNGGMLSIAASKGCTALGVELNPKSVTICKEKGLDVYCGTLEDARFTTASFDTIIMSQVLEHVPSPRKTLREVYRILKSGGKLCLYCPNVDSYLRLLFCRYWHGWHIPFHFYFYNRITLRKLVEDTGLKIIKIDYTTPNHYFVVSLKSYLWRASSNAYRPFDRGTVLDRAVINIIMAPFLRFIDILIKGKGDCILLEAVK